MAHHSVHIDTTQRFEFTSKTQTRLILFILLGLVLVAIGCFIAANNTSHAGHEAAGHEVVASHEPTAGGREANAAHEAAASHHGEHAASATHEGTEAHSAHNEAGAAPAHHAAGWWQRLMANLWMHSVFFTGISIIGTFFLAINYVALAGWSAGLQRVPTAVAAFVPIGLILILITFFVGGHDIFHWTHKELYDPGSPEYDEIIAGKAWYLNTPFFLGKLIIFGGLWVMFWYLIRKNSILEDADGGVDFFRKNKRLSAAFLVIFGVSSSMLAWDWLMSIDSHWYSTLFGWYTFASWFVSGLAVITLTVTFLKDKGLLSHINENHLHDLGKFMFAFSIFWTYLWTAQFLLTWYAAIPEEAIYYNSRIYGMDGHYQGPFFLNLFVNFVFPFLFLMPRPAKRTTIFLKIASFALLAGHWMDHYQMVMPGTIGTANGFGFIEFGMLITFVAALILVISKSLASIPLVAKNHPMLEESLGHDI